MPHQGRDVHGRRICCSTSRPLGGPMLSLSLAGSSLATRPLSGPTPIMHTTGMSPGPRARESMVSCQAVV